jgi:transcriptional regulator with XRE-family HTH domain
LGAFLKAERQRRGWTIRQAAEKAGVSHNRLVEVERGAKYSTDRPTAPSRELLERLAEAYSLSGTLLLALAGYDEGETAILSDEAKQLVTLFEALPQGQKLVALDLVRVLVKHGPGHQP